MASNAITDRPQYRIETRHRRSPTGRVKQTLDLISGYHHEVSVHTEHSDEGTDVWATVTLWNPALNKHNNTTVRVEGYQAYRLLEQILGPLDFSAAAQASRRAAQLAQAA